MRIVSVVRLPRGEKFNIFEDCYCAALRAYGDVQRVECADAAEVVEELVEGPRRSVVDRARSTAKNFTSEGAALFSLERAIAELEDLGFDCHAGCALEVSKRLREKSCGAGTRN